MKTLLFGMSCLIFSLLSPLNASTTEKSLQKDLWLLEKASGGRLGFYAKNLKTSELYRYTLSTCWRYCLRDSKTKN